MLENLVLGGVIIFLAGLIIVKEIIHYRQLEKLTNKILAKDYNDYAYSNLELEKELTKRKTPPKDNKIQPIRV